MQKNFSDVLIVDILQKNKYNSSGEYFATVMRTLTLLDKNGYTALPGRLYVYGDALILDNGGEARLRIKGGSTSNHADLFMRNNSLYCGIYKSDGSGVKVNTLFSASQTITHTTNLTGDLGTFCEATGDIYDGYESITNTDCICQVKTATSLNKKIVGIICSEKEFASHGDVLVRVNDINGLEIGDILCPDENGYGKKADETDLMYMMLHAIPRPKVTSLDTAFEGYVACFLV